MPQITKLSSQKKNKERVNIYIDGSYAFSLSAETLLQEGLEKGASLSEKELEELLFKSEVGKLTDKVVSFISYRPRSEKEIIDRLYKYTKDVKVGREKLIDRVKNKVKSKGLIDDREFAVWFIEQRMLHRPRSKKQLYYELLSKGLDREIVNESINKAGFDEKREITTLIEKKGGGKSEKEMIEYLLRKGFNYGLIKEVLDRD